MALVGVVGTMSGCCWTPEKDGADLSEAARPAPVIEPVVAAEIVGGPITVPIEGTSVELEMLPVNGAPSGGFYACSTEVTWDLYDAFIFNLDTDAGGSTPESDAVTRV